MIKKIYYRVQRTEHREQSTENRVRNKKDKNQRLTIRNGILTFKNVFFLFSVLCFLFSLAGCDAFARKFTRKPKKDKEKKEEMVLVPVEYNAEKAAKQDLYQQYFLFWKTWQEQLIDSLTYDTNRKRSIGCASEAAGSLEQMQKLLKNEKQEELSPYIKQLRDIVTAMENDPYRSKVDSYLAAANRLKARIQKKFSFKKVKDSLQ